MENGDRSADGVSWPEMSHAIGPREFDEALSPEVLLAAYRAGIFPMGEEETDEICWFMPDPRAIIPLERFHVPRRLRRTIRGNRFGVTYNRAFAEVVEGCAGARPVWITDRMRQPYMRLHEFGHAHSVEVWRGGELVGGLYGVQVGAAFMAESKFHRARDASKVALVKLVERLVERGFQILEVQYLTDHLRSFGAVEVALAEYLDRLRSAERVPCRFD